MNFDKLKTLMYLHELISKKATGSPKQLAQKLGVCERTAYNYIEYFRSKGAPVIYCFATENYYYEGGWEFGTGKA